MCFSAQSASRGGRDLNLYKVPILLSLCARPAQVIYGNSFYWLHTHHKTGAKAAPMWERAKASFHYSNLNYYTIKRLAWLIAYAVKMRSAFLCLPLVLALLKMQFAWPRGADFPLAANWTGCALLSKIALVCVLLSFSLSPAVSKALFSFSRKISFHFNLYKSFAKLATGHKTKNFIA